MRRLGVVIAVASGKGGTGKTTMAVALAQAVGGRLLDADVETPNAHLFLNPVLSYEEKILRMIPVVEEERCSFCGRCKEICRFKAITVLPGAVLTFPEMCHACYGCLEVCPEGCIREGHALVGWLYAGEGRGVELAYGALKIGEPMASPLIKALKKKFLSQEKPNIIDCPPGTGCPMLTAVRGADFCLLVAEPTPFGLHDLRQALAAVRALGVPTGVISNRAGRDYPELLNFIKNEGVPLLFQIPEDKKIAQACAQGRGLLDVYPDFKSPLKALYHKLAGAQ